MKMIAIAGVQSENDAVAGVEYENKRIARGRSNILPIKKQYKIIKQYKNKRYQKSNNIF